MRGNFEEIELKSVFEMLRERVVPKMGQVCDGALFGTSEFLYRFSYKVTDLESLVFAYAAKIVEQFMISRNQADASEKKVSVLSITHSDLHTTEQLKESLKKCDYFENSS